MRILAIDTALEACSVCVTEAGAEAPLAIESQAMQRGHAEALMPMLERVMAQVEGGFASLDRVAVTVGPGSFTGLRVGISAARAIALGAGVPAVGVTTLSAYAAPLVATGVKALVAVAIDARHAHVYVQVVAPGGRTLMSPRVTPVKDAARQIGAGPLLVVGSGAAMLCEEAKAIGLEAAVVDGGPAPDITWVARLGIAANPDQALPKPFYLRAPDAKPQDHMRLPRR
ncbi:tRNA (adenosine(37)-N6)-threonylcarbamoyltransferase complex dimerization subunit type 1 TsaB [Alsobacter soli]|uniref:tRNA (Adenosine(37)-N6)-threonylcarbamoyltransferase complex dimerization subunit type 1 TsaB n=1 Tax=Alsobacter soli TaxID=2109933 RepID=A0A2T1HT46_9HYPH|nr:tRNA (adenosine(37)-N6)-threonylcarbamoyltransferase complex dimerization subunit type 1 TsaB [Alsobacter soli]PSC04817.1 tRNA (adenosine(37)-N6)-threonylcarbamoyltransferase complex dimerization subunit type 1 TsaB [Alsobacter soli]